VDALTFYISQLEDALASADGFLLANTSVGEMAFADLKTAARAVIVAFDEENAPDDQE